MSIAVSRTCVAIALALAPASVFAVEPDQMFPQLDACLDAAKQQLEGQPIRWQLTGNQDPYSFDIDIVAPSDRVWNMKCSGGKVSDVNRKTGTKNYKMLSSRVKVPEVSARFTALGAYPIAELKKMEYGLTLRGRAYFSYEMSLNDGRDATVDVNAETGQIDRSKSERND